MSIKEQIDVIIRFADLLQEISNEPALGNEEYARITDLEAELRRIVQDLIVESIHETLEEADEAMEGLNALTEEMEQTVDKVQNVDKIIRIATGTIKFVTSVASGNVGQAASDAMAIVEIIKEDG